MNCMPSIKWKICWIKVRFKPSIQYVKPSLRWSCNILLPAPANGSPKILVCSDDHLLKINVKTADHIIHYDLPDDFETFSFRYTVFTHSHCILPVNAQINSYLIWKFLISPIYSKAIGSANKYTSNKKKPPPSVPSSTVLYVPESSYQKQAILILKFLSRKCVLNLSSKLQCQLLVSSILCSIQILFHSNNEFCSFRRKWLVIQTLILRYVLTFHPILQTLIIC